MSSKTAKNLTKQGTKPRQNREQNRAKTPIFLPYSASNYKILDN
jgi:hypothetical protein